MLLCPVDPSTSQASRRKVPPHVGNQFRLSRSQLKLDTRCSSSSRVASRTSRGREGLLGLLLRKHLLVELQLLALEDVAIAAPGLIASIRRREYPVRLYHPCEPIRSDADGTKNQNLPGTPGQSTVGARSLSPNKSQSL